MKFINKLNIEQLAEIKNFLIEEEKLSNEGFYCNWHNIEKSFNKNCLFALDLDGKIIGFLTWRNRGNQYLDICIMEINPKYRNKGFGKLFYDKVEKYFLSNNFLAIQLFCKPKSSEMFWRKMGFTKLPDRGYGEPELSFFKPLIKTRELSDTNCLINKVELWNLEPYLIKEQPAKWTWNIDDNKYPIFIPCNDKWNLRITKNSQIIKEGKVMDFDRNDYIEIGVIIMY
jgi:GNAT superfamily N-acetyltransferase